MKKIIKISVLSLITFMISNNLPAFSKTPVTKKVEKKASFDFRKTNWGMNFLQVQASEQTNPETSSSDFLSYKDNMFDNEVMIEYYFENNKLINAAYVFGGTFTNQEDYIIYYKKIKASVSSKYGHPKFDNSTELDVMETSQFKHMAELLFRGVNEYKTEWGLPTTNLILNLKGKNMFTKVRLDLMYISRKFQKLDKQKEVDNSKF